MKMQYKGDYLSVPIFCLNCEVSLPHKIIIQSKQKEFEELHPQTNEYLYTKEEYKEIIKCHKCGNWSIRAYVKSKISDWIEDEIIQILPSRKEKVIDKSFERYLPDKSTIFQNYAESIIAFRQDLFFSSGANVRLTLEAICRALNIKRKKHLIDLKKEAIRRALSTKDIPSKWKINNLRNNTGLKQQIDFLIDTYLIPRGLGRLECEILHEIREWGNSVIHSGIIPTEQELLLAFSIMESLIDHAFIQPVKSKAHKKAAKEFKQARRKRK